MGKSVKEGVMPKEFINNRYYGEYATEHRDCPQDKDQPCNGGKKCKGKKVALDDSALKVGWGKDAGYVEVAVVHHRDGAEGSDEYQAWHMQFDRVGLNRAIRTLRQARDEAYGRDE